MRKQIVALGLGLALSGCAADGGWASKSEPVNVKLTLRRTCEAVQVADAAFQALVKAKPELIDENGLAVERTVMASLAPICAPGFSGNLDEAQAVALAAMVQLSALLQNWQK